MTKEKALKDRSYLANVHDNGCYKFSTVETRFLVIFNMHTFQIIDLFHPLTRILCGYIVTKVTDRESSTSEKKFRHGIKSIFALNLNTILMYFYDDDSDYLGVCETDFERSVVVVKQIASVPLFSRACKLVWHPQSNPANLYEGIIIEADCFGRQRNYLVVKMETDEKLQVSQLSVPIRMRACGCFGDLLYGLVYNQTALELGLAFPDLPKQLDLIKFSISTGKYVQEPTINWDIVGKLRWIEFSPSICGVGKTVVALSYCGAESPGMFMMLDLNTLEWKRTNIALNYPVLSFVSGGEQVLFVRTNSDSQIRFNVHRFVFNQPDKLSNLVWLRLKRIFDARPSAYEFILSQLPVNFKQKRPFPQLPTCHDEDLTRSINRQVLRLTKESKNSTCSLM